ncbi:hypothetical protein N665_0245s0010 [Sinapis alba]|nr:hypothetical protein N665_0245s0010 [Sinapis alba]
MKPGGGSGLNPNAVAYVPLSKREGDDAAKPVAAAAATHHVQHQPYGDDDSEMEMELEFLLATFSDLSHDSIREVYLANNSDLDETIEMLTQLEIYSNEAEEYLPVTLDIGDVPETIEPLTSSAPPKQKSASNEETASSSSTSSGTPNNAPVSSS